MDMWDNDGLTDDMIDFLNLIAERVPLRGFDKFRADLDITQDLHGDFSYYVEFDNHEIMFNIAPIIPPNGNSDKSIRRKSLAANAFVCIVFQEAGAVFNPNDVLGRVTQIYITVQPTLYGEDQYYKVCLRFLLFLLQSSSILL